MNIYVAVKKRTWTWLTVKITKKIIKKNKPVKLITFLYIIIFILEVSTVNVEWFILSGADLKKRSGHSSVARKLEKVTESKEEENTNGKIDYKISHTKNM